MGVKARGVRWKGNNKKALRVFAAREGSGFSDKQEEGRSNLEKRSLKEKRREGEKIGGDGRIRTAA